MAHNGSERTGSDWERIKKAREALARGRGLPEGSQMTYTGPGSADAKAEEQVRQSRERARSMFTSGSVDFKPKASDQADGLEGLNRRAAHEPGMASRMRRKRKK